MRAGFEPDKFWLETPATFVNAMEGAALRAEQQYDLLISQEWHGARFNALAQGGKLRSLSSYIGKKPGKKAIAPGALAFFHKMKAAGLPVTITRVPRKTS